MVYRQFAFGAWGPFGAWGAWRVGELGVQGSLGSELGVRVRAWGQSLGSELGVRALPSGGFVMEKPLRGGEPAPAIDPVLAGLGPLTPGPSPPQSWGRGEPGWGFCRHAERPSPGESLGPESQTEPGVSAPDRARGQCPRPSPGSVPQTEPCPRPCPGQCPRPSPNADRARKGIAGSERGSRGQSLFRTEPFQDARYPLSPPPHLLENPPGSRSVLTLQLSGWCDRFERFSQ